MAKKTVNSDIYNLSKLVDDVKAMYIPDETEETLAIGTYGYIGALEANRLQTQVQMTGELSNEVFPSRARLERNVITHAIMNNIEGINAVPSKMTAFLAVRENDILEYFDSNNIFTIDRDCPIHIGDYEFHLEYDIKLRKIYIESKGSNTYTAQYDIPPYRDVPTSTISASNQYLSPPTVVLVNGEAYIYLTVILSQVEHFVESKKLVTSNIVDNKTINFEFDNQLAYFEIHCAESDQDYYITPVFEGSAIPTNTKSPFYCWYQYIDTNLIRVRFDRQSYMPGLNATVECLIKTTQGNGGNFTYSEDTYVDLESSRFKYNNITALVVPISDASGGKDRKSKKELQALIPKEALSRGSLTTIADLNNYFSMLDSDYGRILIQKKIDNQIERVYYAYFVAKDINSNIVPSNTIDVKVGLEDLIESNISDTGSTRYLLPSGTCFKLGEDGMGYVNHDPIVDKGQYFYTNPIPRGRVVTDTLTCIVTDDSYEALSCAVDVDGCLSPTYVFPRPTDRQKLVENNNNILDVEDYIQMSVGRLYRYTAYCTADDDGNYIIDDSHLPCMEFVEGYYKLSNSEEKIKIESLPVTIENVPLGTVINCEIVNRIVDSTSTNEIVYDIKITGNSETLTRFTTFVPSLSQDVFPDTITIGDRITYTLKYKSISNTYKPNVTVRLSRGLEYETFTNHISYEGGESYPMEPAEVSLKNNLGFLYTNPFAANINKHRLYSAFYMMSMSENPYVHFEHINDKSNIQFIATNVQWDREFLGDNKDIYNLAISITQSVQDDLGVYDPETGSAALKVVAVFKRNGKEYRYRSMDLTSVDESSYTFKFTQQFKAEDIFDNDNNIRVSNVQVSGQSEFTVKATYDASEFILNSGDVIMLSTLLANLGIVCEVTEISSSNNRSIGMMPVLDPVTEEIVDYKILALTDFANTETITVAGKNAADEEVEFIINLDCNRPVVGEYGFFNPVSELKIYVLCSMPDTEGLYSKNGFDAVYPGLANWTLTNIYDVVNGVTMYHNYSEIMGSRVRPYGTTVPGTDDILNLEGYIISGIPMLGHDYCQDAQLVQSAINALNYRKAYLENAAELLENSFGLDFKLFNTYGPSKTFYIINDHNNNNVLDDTREYIDRVNITLNFRIKLIADNDSYTKNNIIAEIKSYIEDLDNLNELHIPNLVTQITTNYNEQISYFEYLGFNNYGANIQHIYKNKDSEIPIHVAPEFINVNNLTENSNVIPDINIYLSEI